MCYTWDVKIVQIHDYRDVCIYCTALLAVTVMWWTKDKYLLMDNKVQVKVMSQNISPHWPPFRIIQTDFWLKLDQTTQPFLQPPRSSYFSHCSFTSKTKSCNDKQTSEALTLLEDIIKNPKLVSYKLKCKKKGT